MVPLELLRTRPKIIQNPSSSNSRPIGLNLIKEVGMITIVIMLHAKTTHQRAQTDTSKKTSGDQDSKLCSSYQSQRQESYAIGQRLVSQQNKMKTQKSSQILTRKSFIICPSISTKSSINQSKRSKQGTRSSIVCLAQIKLPKLARKSVQSS